MMRIATARFQYRGDDRVDITRKPGESVFAPSWPLLREAKARMLEDAVEAWKFYVPRYMDEMRHSWRDHRAEWAALVARDRVVLVCHCAKPGMCHRSLLAGILLEVVPDSTNEGEIRP